MKEYLHDFYSHYPDIFLQEYLGINLKWYRRVLLSRFRSRRAEKIDFNKRKFIKAFERFSVRQNYGNPYENWNRIVSNHCDLTPEENLARLVWKGIDAQTREYKQEIDEIFS